MREKTTLRANPVRKANHQFNLSWSFVNYISSLSSLFICIYAVENEFAESASSHSSPLIDGCRRVFTSIAWLVPTMTGDRSSLSPDMQLRPLWKVIWWCHVMYSVTHGTYIGVVSTQTYSLGGQDCLKTTQQVTVCECNTLYSNVRYQYCASIRIRLFCCRI